MEFTYLGQTSQRVSRVALGGYPLGGHGWGTVDPEQPLTQSRARPGDRLVLTKPIGFGIAAQAIKKGKLSNGEIAIAVAAMATLNKGAKDAALAAGACGPASSAQRPYARIRS